jgi:hypothetical protein
MILSVSDMWASLFLGCDDHVHVPALQPGMLLDRTDIGQGIADIFHNFSSDLGIGDLAAPEHHGYLDFVLLLQKFLYMLNLNLDVMIFRLGPQSDFLDLDDGLALLGDVHLLALLVPELSVIHNPAYRRIGIGRYLNQIQASSSRLGQGVRQGQNSQLLSIGVNDADAGNLYLAIDF